MEQIGIHLRLSAPVILATLLDEFSAVTDYRTLRDSLPRRLAHILQCRSVLLYQRIGETLQFVSGTFDDVPGWSESLLTIAHINPISLTSDLPEACAWRSRRAVASPVDSSTPTLISVPLIYRQRAIGVLVTFRSEEEAAGLSAKLTENAAYWMSDELPVLEAAAGVVALLLENTRLLERDRQRIHELSLLNSIASQLNCSLYEPERVHSIVIQRTREITAADVCEWITPASASCEWITPAFQQLLLSRFSQRREPHLTPLIIERPGDAYTTTYLEHLPANIKTFFAIPLLVSESTLHRYAHALGRLGGQLNGHPHDIFVRKMAGERQSVSLSEVPTMDEPKVLGVVVGAYYRPWKLRREEVVLLQVLASQASAVLENMHLMAEVVEARNEARKLLRQVLDDQRLKELILESVPSGLITVDLFERITTFNRAAEAILGYHLYEVLGQPLQKILNVPRLADTAQGEEQAGIAADKTVHTLPGGETIAETFVTVDRNGQEVVLDVQVAPLHNDQREQIGRLATFTNVTSMYRLQEEKRRLDRLASLGEMAASVAHEVRNPLASIKTSMQMLKADLEGQAQGFEEAQESVSVVLKEVERLDAIVRDLLLFARPRQLHCVLCNLVELSEHVLHMLQQQCMELGVDVHRVYHDVPMVSVDLGQMEQVLFNLYMNALQAMPDGGVLTVSCQVVASGTSSIEAARESGGQDWLELSISDTGIGIAPDELERIFQPFFTTKAHGIGLGLPITRRLIEDHRGHLLVQSQLGYGATFSVRLPLADSGL